jgi:cobalt/nickel transport system permease protein/cobalt/nickel transport protein
MSRRAFYVTVVVVALLVAGVGSLYASSHPDGLEYVAEQTGFLDSAQDSATAGSPFADYGNAGGVVGVVLVLVLMTGLTLALRRRSPKDD